MDYRIRRTELAARRLIKSHVRDAIYRAKAEQNAVYERMLYLETAISEEAQQEWATVRTLWREESDLPLLLPVLTGVLQRVLIECQDAYPNDPEAQRALRHFTTSNLNGMMS